MTVLALGFFLYFAPSLIASSRRHTSAPAIWFTNFLLGWTGFGWLVCLIWALSLPQPILLYPVATYGPVCAACYRPLPAISSYCTLCGAIVQRST